MSKGSLAGYGALITGGAGGFGRAAAARLVRDGAAVTLMGRTASSLKNAAEDLLKQHPQMVPPQIVVGDATDEDALAEAVEAADRVPLRIAIGTVGGTTVAPLLGLSAETLMENFERNVTSALRLVKHAATRMSHHGGGSVVLTSSSAAGHAFAFMPAYSIAKAGLEALVRVAAEELGHLGVRVNAVRPGLVATGGKTPSRLASDQEEVALVRREKPLEHQGTAQDVAEAMRHLAGPESQWTTGAVLPVEGGAHIRRAPRLEKLARSVCGDDVIDAALRGEISNS